MTKQNLLPIVKIIFSDYYTKIIDILHQKHCSVDGTKSWSNDNKLLYKKTLSLITIKYPQYNINDIILLDDDIEKTYNNPIGSVFLVPKWDGVSKNDPTLKYIGYHLLRLTY